MNERTPNVFSHYKAVSRKRRALAAMVATAAVVGGAGIVQAIGGGDTPAPTRPDKASSSTAAPSIIDGNMHSDNPYVCIPRGRTEVVRLDHKTTFVELADEESVNVLHLIDQSQSIEAIRESQVGAACLQAFIEKDLRINRDSFGPDARADTVIPAGTELQLIDQSDTNNGVIAIQDKPHQ